MIRLRDVSKQYRTRSGPHRVLDAINMDVQRGEKIGILGRNGAGKSTLIRLISGAESPSQGQIERGMRVSWPLAFGGGFQGSLTGLDNLRFVCRIYGADYQTLSGYVADFSELGRYLREPVKTYSSGMRARLAFALSMAIDFDCFLIDEVIAVGDHRFQERCRTELFERRGDRAMILVSHQPKEIQRYCTRAYVLDSGHLHGFDTVGEAYGYYEQR